MIRKRDRTPTLPTQRDVKPLIKLVSPVIKSSLLLLLLASTTQQVSQRLGQPRDRKTEKTKN